ncbi:hypothetical protein [Pseudarthrobacter sp. TAF60_1]|uniref:hypothetical protein n=1 Tax=Pseudarthrobacter sp. TAF60_1 TaxID=3233071 RepID=UPI003F95B17B
MAADKVAALQRAGPAGLAGLAGPVVANDAGGWDVLGAAELGAGLAESVPGAEDPCGCAWLGPHAVSISAAAATAVVIKNPCEMR